MPDPSAPVSKTQGSELSQENTASRPMESVQTTSALRTLSDCAMNRGLSWGLQARLDCFLSLLNLVARAHSRGFVFHSLQPQNILVGALDEIVIGDCSDEPSETLSLHPYLAPECLDNPELRSVAADYYALGAILYLLVTETPPYPETASNLRSLIQLHDIQAASEKTRFELSAALEAEVVQALAVDPEARPKNLADWRSRLSKLSQRSLEETHVIQERRQSFLIGLPITAITVVVSLIALTVFFVIKARSAFEQSAQLKERYDNDLELLKSRENGLRQDRQALSQWQKTLELQQQQFSEQRQKHEKNEKNERKPATIEAQLKQLKAQSEADLSMKAGGDKTKLAEALEIAERRGQRADEANVRLIRTQNDLKKLQQQLLIAQIQEKFRHSEFLALKTLLSQLNSISKSKTDRECLDALRTPWTAKQLPTFYKFQAPSSEITALAFAIQEQTSRILLMAGLKSGRLVCFAICDERVAKVIELAPAAILSMDQREKFLFAVNANSQLTSIDLQTLTVKTTEKLPFGSLSSAQFLASSATETVLQVLSKTGRLGLWNVGRSEPMAQAETDCRTLTQSLLTDSSLLFADARQRFWSWDLSKPKQAIQKIESHFGISAFSRNSRNQLCFASGTEILPACSYSGSLELNSKGRRKSFPSSFEQPIIQLYSLSEDQLLAIHPQGDAVIVPASSSRPSRFASSSIERPASKLVSSVTKRTGQTRLCAKQFAVSDGHTVVLKPVVQSSVSIEFQTDQHDVSRLAQSDKYELIAIGDSLGQLILRDRMTGFPLAQKRVANAPLQSLQFCHADNWIIFTDRTGQQGIVQALTLEAIKPWSTPLPRAQQQDFIEDSQILVSSFGTSLSCVSETVNWTLNYAHPEAIRGLAYFADFQTILSLDDSGRLKLWNLQSGRPATRTSSKTILERQLTKSKDTQPDRLFANQNSTEFAVAVDLRELFILDSSTLKIKGAFKAFRTQILTAQQLPTGGWLVLLANGELHLCQSQQLSSQTEPQKTTLIRSDLPKMPWRNGQASMSERLSLLISREPHRWLVVDLNRPRCPEFLELRDSAAKNRSIAKFYADQREWQSALAYLESENSTPFALWRARTLLMTEQQQQLKQYLSQKALAGEPLARLWARALN